MKFVNWNVPDFGSFSELTFKGFSELKLDGVYEVMHEDFNKRPMYKHVDFDIVLWCFKPEASPVWMISERKHVGSNNAFAYLESYFEEFPLHASRWMIFDSIRKRFSRTVAPIAVEGRCYPSFTCLSDPETPLYVFTQFSELLSFLFNNEALGSLITQFVYPQRIDFHLLSKTLYYSRERPQLKGSKHRILTDGHVSVKQFLEFFVYSELNDLVQSKGSILIRSISISAADRKLCKLHHRQDLASHWHVDSCVGHPFVADINFVEVQGSWKNIPLARFVKGNAIHLKILVDFFGKENFNNYLESARRRDVIDKPKPNGSKREPTHEREESTYRPRRPPSLRNSDSSTEI